MSYLKRNGNKWTINELLSLQREYELLEWSIQKIALKHSRSIESILYKLEEEGFILSWADARGFNPSQYKKQINNVEHDEDDDEEYEEEDDLEDEEEDDDEDEDLEEDDEEEMKDELKYKKDDNENDFEILTERVWNLETSLSDIGAMVKQMFHSLVLKNNKKCEPLRTNKFYA
jgi:ribosomal protein S8